jgi:spore germination protein
MTRAAGWGAAALAAALLALPVGAAAAADSSAAGASSAASPPAAAGGAHPQFSDVAGNWAVGDIDTLLEAGILTVPPDGLFRPSDPVTRLDFAVWVAKAMELQPSTAPLGFADAAQVPQEDQGEVGAAVAAGLIQGYPGNLFLPDNPITRAEIATIFGRALEAKGETAEWRFTAIFADGSTIPTWALPATVIIKDQLMYGEPCAPEPCFAPSQNTTRAEATTFIVRFMQYLTSKYHSAPLPQPTITGNFTLGMWYSNSDEAYANLEQYGGSLNELIYGGYDIQDGGTLAGYDSPRTLAWASGHATVPLWVMLQAASLSFLGNQAQTDTLLNSLVAIVQRAGYAGVNFDIEGVPGADRAAYTAFITEAASRLHAIGVKISVAVPSETALDLGQWWDEAYDYPALGSVVDQLIMMAYDYHYAGGTPGPISPIAWDQAVIAYASSVMPPNKVILGLPAYGYIWNASTDAGVAYWVSGMENMAAQHGASIQHDATADEGTYTYQVSGQTYVGWYVDAQGAADRIQLAHAMGIGGVVAWRLDYDTPTWWPAWTQALDSWR